MAAPTRFPASLFPSLPFPMSTFTTPNSRFGLLFFSYQLQTLFVSRHGGLSHAYYFSFPLFPNLILNLVTSLADSKALVLQRRPSFLFFQTGQISCSLYWKTRTFVLTDIQLPFTNYIFLPGSNFDKVKVNNVTVLLTCNRSFSVNYS